MFENITLTRFAASPLPICRLRPFLPGALIAIFFCQPALAAGIGNMFRPFLDYTVVADDNILRIRDRMDTQALLGTNNLFDISQRVTGGVMFEKEISRQRLSANANWSYNRFERFDQMNNNLKNFSGNWNWFLGNRLEGNMGASHAQSLVPFLFQPGVKNIRTEQTEFINAAWRLHPSWRLNGDYTRYDLNTNSPSNRLRFLNRTEDRFEAGFDYLATSNSTVGILLRNIHGDFPVLVQAPDGSFTDNGFDQKEALAKINWVVSEKSRLQGTGGWVERKNASFAQRNFSGFNARLIYRWQPTDKLGLTITGWRETAAMQNLSASFSLNTGVSAAPSWNITEKVRLEGDFSYDNRKFNQFAILTDPLLAIGRNNTFRNAAIKLIYSLYPGLQLNASAYHTDLKSDASLGGYNANGANINLQYIYGRQ